MTRNLETADYIVKLVLALGIIVLYLTKVIAGPFAIVLLVLAGLILLLDAVKLLLPVFFPRRRR